MKSLQDKIHTTMQKWLPGSIGENNKTLNLGLVNPNFKAGYFIGRGDHKNNPKILEKNCSNPSAISGVITFDKNQSVHKLVNKGEIAVLTRGEPKKDCDYLYVINWVSNPNKIDDIGKLTSWLDTNEYDGICVGGKKYEGSPHVEIIDTDQSYSIAKVVIDFAD